MKNSEMQFKILCVKKATRQQICTPGGIYENMAAEANADREIFCVIHLNARNRIIEKEIVSIGNVCSSLVHPREVFKKAILNSASSIILVHNHPSNDNTPSEDDLKLTQKLIQAGQILGIEVLDHIILTSSNFYSFKSEGLIVILSRKK